MNCPKCGQRNASSFSNCVHCGALLTNRQQSSPGLSNQINADIKQAPDGTYYIGGKTGAILGGSLAFIMVAAAVFFFGGFYDQWRESTGYIKEYYGEICERMITGTQRQQLQSQGYSFSRYQNRSDNRSHQEGSSFHSDRDRRECWNQTYGLQPPPSQPRGVRLRHRWIHPDDPRFPYSKAEIPQ